MEYMPVTQSMFLVAETRDQPMHVGGLQLFIPRDGQSPAELAEEVHARFVAATGVQPLFRKRPASPAAVMGLTAWQHDDEIDFDYHVRRIVLPRPGEIKNLLRYVSLNHGALLDRNRPMWEVHIIEGLRDGRIALYTKIHHSLADGVTALRILQRSLTTDPDDRSGTSFWDPALLRRRRPRKPKTPSGLLSKVTGTIGSAVGLADDLIGLGPAAAKVAIAGVFDKDFVAPMQMAPVTALNVTIGSARRFAAQDWPTDRLRDVARRHGVTFNDVLIAMCAGALRRYLHDHHELPDSTLTACLPVSLHGEGDGDGNAITAIIVRMATDIDDPAARLREIRASSSSAKNIVRGLKPIQSLALGAANAWPLAFATVPGFVKYTPHGFNLMISSVPGPDMPLYWNGARLDGCYPVSIPMDGLAMNITITTVGGKANFGIIGARAQLPSLQRILDHLDTALLELEDIAPIGA
ncbi:wax ester/triacylglycerol synthase family O-acyltransferase [Gordonia sp. (in: high G+C Gram-positive bacteria)]|uniref:WS/DGAT/MGAT family O-acyltransferase n=1 Tax=Gordonia sp. (in: high G+C Gram-positive bacteria) TaxID=84139 RepID=UPI00352707EE